MSERETEESSVHENVRVVRLGHGANCSSLGSVVDTLFATAVLGSAVYVAVAAALERETVTRVVPEPAPAVMTEEQSAEKKGES